MFTIIESRKCQTRPLRQKGCVRRGWRERSRGLRPRVTCRRVHSRPRAWCSCPLRLRRRHMGKKLYVGNLPFNTTDESLQEIFAQAGSVQSAKIITDRDTGRSKGFGFVEMATDQEAADAIQKFNGAEYGGRNMTVAEARPMAPREGGGGHRGGGGGRNRW